MFEFADEICFIPFYHCTHKWAINILVDKAFSDDWFNQTYDLNLEKEEFAQLLKVATTNQLFSSMVILYDQTDGVAMGSPLGPLMANVFMCHLENSSHATIWCPLCIIGIMMILLLECLAPLLLLIFWLHWMVYTRAWGLQWNFLLIIWSLPLDLRY